MVRALVRNGLNRQIGSLKASLGRYSFDSNEYQAAFSELLRLEEKRRALTEEL